MDALIGGAGATEAYLADQNAQRVKAQLNEAYKTAKDDPSEKNLARVQELEDQYALSKAWAMLGTGLAVGTGIGVFTSKYASKRGSVPKAEEELAILRRAIADLKKQANKPPKAPKPPPASPNALAVPTIPPLPPARPRGTRKPPVP
jgi:polyhydroxyalkanoate synthesis regulator phasin